MLCPHCLHRFEQAQSEYEYVDGTFCVVPSGQSVKTCTSVTEGAVCPSELRYASAGG